MASDIETAAMRRALELAATVLGSTNPNPAVAAVILDRTGQVIGEGATQPAGSSHAEVVALRAAGKSARDATLVVTLEPCRHTGRTGPCTTAIVEAGISRVVYAAGDPHQAAAGGGELLRSAGIDVEAGVLRDEVEDQLHPWLTAIRRRRPYVTWKYAATLDGRTAAADGTSRWITGEQARVDVHRERAMADAVVVGIGTVLADDPQLTVRDWQAARQPLRVVVDGTARTPGSARVLDAAAPTLVAVGEDADPARVEELSRTGASVVGLSRRDGRVDLGALLACLHDREVNQVLVEGGATLAASFLRDRLVDRVVGYHAPALLGAGPPVLGDVGVSTIGQATRLRLEEMTRLGDDVRLVASLRREDG